MLDGPRRKMRIRLGTRPLLWASWSMWAATERISIARGQGAHGRHRGRGILFQSGTRATRSWASTFNALRSRVTDVQAPAQDPSESPHRGHHLSRRHRESSNFNGTPVPAGSFIWFSANFTAHGVPSSGVTLDFTSGNISFAAGGTSYNLAVPNAKITFSTSASCTSTTFDSVTNTWITTVPVSGDDEIFLTGLAWPVPTGGLPGGANPVNFSGTYSAETSAPGLSIQMKWGAAAYSSFTTDYNALQVKAGHQTACGLNTVTMRGLRKA
jgi:hypothetical protein